MQTRTQFISPLLEALGWDVRNEAGVPYHLCEVWEEKGETHGRPDYTFRLNGQTKFFLEVKSPSEALRTDDILQTKRYAWNSRDIFFAGVCDFEQFRFFDASLRPDEKRPYDGEAFHLIYSEYAEKIDKLWELSRDRVAAGSLDQFLRKDRKSLLQKIPVDKDFLDNLTTWRHDLANAIHAQNPEHDVQALNDIVQRLLDRIIFIRIAEDRKVIDQRQLWDIAVIWEESGGRRNIMEQLVQVFQEFNTRFNGEIFKPHPCEEIKIESHVLVKIIRQLYPPKSNYRFDVIGVELLGSIYERYLGNTLRITPKRVFIEPKPEVRKAGGVYYTPQYIVDYIVRNTVGKLVEDKSPKEVDKIRILDPACGSGSFLIGAFQFLIDWYLNYYREHPKEAAAQGLVPMTRTDPDGNLRLSFYAKSLIIQHNLYGVDIDPQAVEVTMMSLYLKMLEGELGIQIPKQDKLPELKYNVRCGNSLISPDIEDDKPLSAEERQRINPFNWNDRENGFGDILQSGGFDAVIGNPPYIGFHGFMKDKKYLKEAFASAKGKFDYYLPFIERGLSLLREGGLLSFICPTNFTKRGHGEALRAHIAKSVRVEEICDFQDVQVFSGALNYVGIFLFRKSVPLSEQYLLYRRRSLSDPGSRIRQATLGRDPWVFRDEQKTKIVESIEKSAPVRLAELTSGISEGIVTGMNDVFLMPLEAARHVGLESDVIRHCIRGNEVRRYFLEPIRDVVLYPYRLKTCRTEALPEARLRKFKHAWKYLNSRRRELGGRPYFESSSKAWYELWCQRDLRLLTAPKIVVPELAESSRFAIADSTQFYGDTVCGITLRPDLRESLNYLLGLLNSKLIDFYYREITVPKANGFYIYKTMFLKRIPIRRIDFNSQADVHVHHEVSRLIQGMLELNKKKHSDKLAPTELQRLEREIAATDAEIDNLVYGLYGITAEERKIIEAQN
ncbi:MAG TPA: N-6 DNA methylase [Candidatus Acidoferrales bacterium]|nr:N-6 DNA methylase [Candidatus Acidoferrales bacterium]